MIRLSFYYSIFCIFRLEVIKSVDLYKENELSFYYGIFNILGLQVAKSVDLCKKITLMFSIT